MEIRYSSHPEDVKYYTTEELRDHFLIPDLFQYGEIKSVYCHEDRMIVGSAVPTTGGAGAGGWAPARMRIFYGKARDGNSQYRRRRACKGGRR